MERIKMPRENRAYQFAPFDTLNGLSLALRKKEYEHEKITKKELSIDQKEEISKIFSNIKVDEIIGVKYFKDGYEYYIEGKIKLYFKKNIITINNIVISIDNILEVNYCNNDI